MPQAHVGLVNLRLPIRKTVGSPCEVRERVEALNATMIDKIKGEAGAALRTFAVAHPLGWK